MPRFSALRLWSVVAISYGLLACALLWPLPRHLSTSLPGDPAGDLGVYIWNIWIFRHEVLAHGRLPFSTDHIFSYGGGIDFSLHNYAPVASLLGAPFVGLLGIVATFNLLLLASVALTGAATFLLARRIGLGVGGAWCAGALFMASPVLSARETAHFSLVIAAPLALFPWALLRTFDRMRRTDAMLIGAVVAVAFYADAYYGIYCALMGAFLVAWRFTRVEWRGSEPRTTRVGRLVDIALAIVAGVIVWRALGGVRYYTLGPLRIALDTYYNLFLILVILLLIRAWIVWRPALRLDDPDGRVPRLWRLALVAVCMCLLLILPVIVGIAVRVADDQLPGTEIFWRSSPRGVDALAYLVPNPASAWFGDRTREWLTAGIQDAFPEFVASFSLVAFLVIAAGAWLRALPRIWVWFTIFFFSLSLGPFVHVAGVNTYVIGPWALLRYAPVIGMARSPSRFAIVAVLGLSLLFAFAIERLWKCRVPVRAAAAGALALALTVELCPAPRRMFSAAVPDVYSLVAAGGDESGRLLELPTGVRDGTSSLGNFSAADVYFQTKHHRPLIGGYLSRVSASRKRTMRRVPMLRALFVLSEGRPLPPGWAEAAYQSRDAFLRRSCVRYVIVNKHFASSALQEFAVHALGLQRMHEDAEYALFVPVNPPACAPRRTSRLFTFASR